MCHVILTSSKTSEVAAPLFKKPSLPIGSFIYTEWNSWQSYYSHEKTCPLDSIILKDLLDPTLKIWLFIVQVNECMRFLYVCFYSHLFAVGFLWLLWCFLSFLLLYFMFALISISIRKALSFLTLVASYTLLVRQEYVSFW